MAGMHRCSGILFWLIKTLFKFINSGIKLHSKIGHDLPNIFFLSFLLIYIYLLDLSARDMMWHKIKQSNSDFDSRFSFSFIDFWSKTKEYSQYLPKEFATDRMLRKVTFQAKYGCFKFRLPPILVAGTKLKSSVSIHPRPFPCFGSDTTSISKRKFNRKRFSFF